MMRDLLARVASLIGLGALVLLAGCFQVEQKWTVYSDGSGKMVQTVTIDKGQAEMLRNMGQSGPGGGSGAAGAGIPEGVRGTIGQKVQMVVTEYYEDISKVEQPGVSFAFTRKEDGGCALKMNYDVETALKAAQMGVGGAMAGGEKDDATKEGDGEPGGMGGMDPGMVEGIMSQMRQTIIFVMPGEVARSSRGEVKGRIVTYALAGQDLTNPKEKTLSFEITSGAPAKEARAEFESFQKEIEKVQRAEVGGK